MRTERNQKIRCTATIAIPNITMMKYRETIIGNDIEFAKQLLRNNELVAIPTETVYGLAANAFSEQAVREIFLAKDRPSYNPLIVHVGSIEQLADVVSDMPPAATVLLQKFAPGPLTLVLPKTRRVPDIVTAGLPDVAVRIPAHPLALTLLQELDFPLAAPSANPFGYISPTTAIHVKQMMNGRIPYILDGGECAAGIESTIVGFKGNTPVIYRQGVITVNDIAHCLGEVELSHEKKILAPGMLDSHYAPRTPLYLTEDIETMLAHMKGANIGIITYNTYSQLLPEAQQIMLYANNNLAEGAHNIYSALHNMDGRGYDAIVVKKLPDQGIGAAINDRLWRASKK